MAWVPLLPASNTRDTLGGLHFILLLLLLLSVLGDELGSWPLVGAGHGAGCAALGSFLKALNVRSIFELYLSDHIQGSVLHTSACRCLLY
jgi:hypothetical protein